MQEIIGQFKTGQASAALSQYRRVRLDNNLELAYCSDTSTDGLGELTRDVLAADDQATYRVANGDGTHIFIASGSISAGAAVYAAASGKVAGSGTVLIGEAITAAGADGDQIEVQPSSAAILGDVARSSITQQDLVSYPIAIGEFRVWDAPSTVAVAATGANDDLAVVYNTFLTAAPTIETGDLKNAGATTRKVGFQFQLPVEYVAGQTITLRINAGMKTTVASVSATVDAQVANITNDATADICATSAASINSLTPANKDFTITPTNAEPGDVLDVVLSVAVNDSGTGTAVIGQINSVAFLLDVKG